MLFDKMLHEYAALRGSPPSYAAYDVLPPQPLLLILRYAVIAMLATNIVRCRHAALLRQRDISMAPARFAMLMLDAAFRDIFRGAIIIAAMLDAPSLIYASAATHDVTTRHNAVTPSCCRACCCLPALCCYCLPCCFF